MLVAFVPGRDSQLVGALRDCAAAGVEVDVVPRFYDLVGPNPRVRSLGALGLVQVPGRGLNLAQRVKRAVDVAGAGSCSLLLSPVLVVVAARRLPSPTGAPVLFRQKRIGRAGAPSRS